jgi:hypothetical protein
MKIDNFDYPWLTEKIFLNKYKSINMKEYKIIKQTGTAVKSQQNFEDLINSYAKMNWTVINMFTHRGILKALIERDKKEDES